MKRPIQFSCRLLSLVCILAAARVFAQVNSSSSIDEIRRALDEKARQRATAPKPDELPWQEDPRPDLSLSDPRLATIELESEADRLACVWTFRALEKPNAPPLRALVDAKGRQWLRLPPGEYEVALRVGIAAEKSVQFVPGKVRVRAGSAHRSTFTKKDETRIERQWIDETRKDGGKRDDPEKNPSRARR